MPEAMISVKNVSKSYHRGNETLKVLDKLNLEMEPGASTR
jgi:ABC-type lipoprotein export system ATPase subunit